jgi:predicted amidohydrolase YtcJ
VSASLLIVNARPWSGVPLACDAVLVRDARIAAIGRAAELLAAGSGARVVDAAGGTVTPGFTDAHLHFVPWARARRQPDLGGARTRADALTRVAAVLAAMSAEDAPIVGRGWDESGWEALPDRAALDALAPERPLILHRHDFHALWVNSAALAAAGVTRATPDPAGGRFERDGSGEPTGLVREHAVGAFRALEERAAPAVDDALLAEAAAALHAEGVTSVHDFQREHVDWRRMRALAGSGRLRVLQQVGPEQLRDRAALGLAAGEGDDWFRTGSLKLFADGTLGSRTAALLEPYADSGGRGMALLSPAELAAAVGEAAVAGFSVAIHAIGDAAVRHALDAIERHHARLARLPLPPRIEHVQLLADADLPRFAALGVAASMQPQHATTDAPVARAAWGPRCRMSYPWRSLLGAGARLAFGSDAPVEPPVARLGLAAAVARTGADGLPFEPAQAIPLDAVLTAYTRAPSALAGGRLGPGRLEVGAPADLVLWDRDLHAAGPAGLAEARPRLTALAGEIVYESRAGESGRRTGAAHGSGATRISASRGQGSEG